MDFTQWTLDEIDDSEAYQEKDDICTQFLFGDQSEKHLEVDEQNEDDQEIPCCPICSRLWLKTEGIVERENHVMECLVKVNSPSLSSSSESDVKLTPSIQNNGQFSCPICSSSFPTEHAVEQHVDKCLQIEPGTVEKNNENATFCPVCCAALPKLVPLKIRHIKACASKANVQGPRDLQLEECDDPLALLIEEANRLDEADISKNNNNNSCENTALNLSNLSSLAVTVEDRTPSLKKITQFFPRTSSSAKASTSKVQNTTASKRVKITTPSPATPATTPKQPDRPWNNCPYWKRIPDATVIVDGFQYAHPDLSSVYILSHFHYDHYNGLSKHFNAGTIYCSPTTARLVKSVVKINSSRVKTLVLGEPYVLPDGTTVIALDANHAPGSCVFVFLTKTGRVYVHTGDFRANDALAGRIRQIAFRWGKGIEGLYLDTTYCNPEFNFLPQQVVIERCAAEVKKHLTQYPRTLVVFGAYTIGKERIALASLLPGKKLAVTRQKLNIIKCCCEDFSMAEMACFTTNRALTNYWIVSMADLDTKKLEKLRKAHANRFDHILAVRATGWVKEFRVVRAATVNLTTLFVPYSEHSSFGELKRFVRQVNARNVVPTVMTKSSSKEEMLRLLCY